MKIISHRGNLIGSCQSLENNPTHITQLLNNNMEVEIDVWYIQNKYMLGHDQPVYEVSKKFLKHKNLWCHAKNLEAVEQMAKDKAHYFWHENDKMTLTSKGVPWCFPNTYVSNGITVMIGEDVPTQSIHGICTDYPTRFV